jgi:hypothetical protein
MSSLFVEKGMELEEFERLNDAVNTQYARKGIIDQQLYELNETRRNLPRLIKKMQRSPVHSHNLMPELAKVEDEYSKKLKEEEEARKKGEILNQQFQAFKNSLRLVQLGLLLERLREMQKERSQSYWIINACLQNKLDHMKRFHLRNKEHDQAYERDLDQHIADLNEYRRIFPLDHHVDVLVEELEEIRNKDEMYNERQRRTAFAMSGHPRLGGLDLSPELMALIHR